MSSYDSRKDTEEHIGHVRSFLERVCSELARRAEVHDASKLCDEEKILFDRYTPLLAQTTYGSEGYKGYLKNLEPALKSHDMRNSHHPEHYADGVDGMSLLDVVEMFCDWKAATMRHNDGDIRKSIRINEKCFGISEQLTKVFENTVRELGWE